MINIKKVFSLLKVVYHESKAASNMTGFILHTVNKNNHHDIYVHAEDINQQFTMAVVALGHLRSNLPDQTDEEFIEFLNKCLRIQFSQNNKSQGNLQKQE